MVRALFDCILSFFDHILYNEISDKRFGWNHAENICHVEIPDPVIPHGIIIFVQLAGLLLNFLP